MDPLNSCLMAIFMDLTFIFNLEIHHCPMVILINIFGWDFVFTSTSINEDKTGMIIVCVMHTKFVP